MRRRILATEATGRRGGGHDQRRQGAGGSPTAPLALLDALEAIVLAGAFLLRWWRWVTPLSVLVVLTGDLLLRPLFAPALAILGGLRSWAMIGADNGDTQGVVTSMEAMPWPWLDLEHL
jgi:hypothetical protein